MGLRAAWAERRPKDKYVASSVRVREMLIRFENPGAAGVDVSYVLV
jgi:hypothetical protein